MDWRFRASSLELRILSLGLGGFGFRISSLGLRAKRSRIFREFSGVGIKDFESKAHGFGFPVKDTGFVA